jgi:hypothetical protein
MSLDLTALGNHVAQAFPGAVVDQKFDRGELTLTVSADALVLGER